MASTKFAKGKKVSDAKAPATKKAFSGKPGVVGKPADKKPLARPAAVKPADGGASFGADVPEAEMKKSAKPVKPAKPAKEKKVRARTAYGVAHEMVLAQKHTDDEIKAAVKKEFGDVRILSLLSGVRQAINRAKNPPAKPVVKIE
jgi:hypothetical protein